MMRHKRWIFIFVFLLIFIGFFYHNSPTGAQGTDISEPQTIQLTYTDDAYWPSWSPDGSRIAFYKRFDYYINRFDRDTQEPICHLWVMNADGSEARMLWDAKIRDFTNWPIWPPEWSSNGDLLAIERIPGSTSAVILDSWTGVIVRDSLSTGWCHVPRFSPEGLLLTFSRLIPEWETKEGINERSIILLDMESGKEQVIHRTRFMSETEWREWPAIWSVRGRLIRIRDYWRFGRRTNTCFYHYYDILSGELLLTSLDPDGNSDLPDMFPDLRVSPSGDWQVIAPRIRDNLELPDLRGRAGLRKGLKIARLGERGLELEEFAPVTKGTYIFSYQWHAEEDRLLFAVGEKSLDMEQSEVSNIYIAILPD